MVSRIHALAGDVGRLLVLLVDLEEARRLTVRLGDRLLLVALGALQDALGLAARLRHHLVGVGVGLVLQPLLVGARGLHVAEGVDDLGRRVDLLQLHLVDADAGAVVVEHLLHQLLHGLLGLLARSRVRIGWMFDLADDLAHGALGHLFDGGVGVLDVEQVLLRRP